MELLSARGESFPTHCNATGNAYEGVVSREVTDRMTAAGWLRADLAARVQVHPALDQFSQAVARRQGYRIGFKSEIEGIYANPDFASVLIHLETSGSPKGKAVGGFAKSCTMHKVDSRLQMSWRIGLTVGVTMVGILVSNYLPKPESVAAAVLGELSELMTIHFVLTDSAGFVQDALGPDRLHQALLKGHRLPERC